MLRPRDIPLFDPLRYNTMIGLFFKHAKPDFSGKVYFFCRKKSQKRKGAIFMRKICGGENVIVEDNGCSLVIHALNREEAIRYEGPFAARLSGADDGAGGTTWTLGIVDPDRTGGTAAGAVWWKVGGAVSSISVPAYSKTLTRSNNDFTLHLAVYYDGTNWTTKFLSENPFACVGTGAGYHAAALFPICRVRFRRNDASPSVTQIHRSGDIIATYPGYAGPFAILKKLAFAGTSEIPTVSYCVQPGKVKPGMSRSALDFPKTEIANGDNILLRVEYNSANSSFTLSLANSGSTSNTIEYIPLKDWCAGDITISWRY